MKKYQIFVSSTYVDLIDERQAAVEAILKAGHIPAGMELFTATNQSQWTIIQKWIDESDIYMLILGGRYGSIEPISGLSYTELEYDYALKKGKPLFAVVMQDAALDEKVRTVGRSVLEAENPQKLRDFKEKVLNYMSSFFEDYKDIKLAVHESVGKLQQDNQLIGWVRADELLNPEKYLDQISAIQKEKEDLQKEISKLKRLKSTGDDPEEFDEIIAILSAQTISLVNIRTAENNMPAKTSVLQAFSAFKNSLINGINIVATSSEQRRFLVNELSPILQIHGLMCIEKATSSSPARRVIMTEKGQKLLAYMAKKEHVYG